MTNMGVRHCLCLVIAASIAALACAQAPTLYTDCNSAKYYCKKSCDDRNLWVKTYNCKPYKDPNSRNPPTVTCACGTTKSASWLDCPLESAQYMNDCPVPKNDKLNGGNGSSAAVFQPLLSAFIAVFATLLVAFNWRA